MILNRIGIEKFYYKNKYSKDKFKKDLIKQFKKREKIRIKE